MLLKFTKMHGLGNDFMVIDGINQSVTLTAEQVACWADRHFGIGFDQLLLVEAPQSAEAQFKYRIFNADGGEVSQCGNGARCFARFVREKGLTRENPISVETDSGILHLNAIDDSRVQVDMGVPRFEPAQIPLLAEQQADQYRIELGDGDVMVSAISMGNPHAIIQVDDIDNIAIDTIGPALQASERFPQSVNVGFMQVVGSHSFRLRVYERGVGETMACGSGACAAMAAGRQLGLLDDNATASLSGGNLELNWQGTGKPVMMTGETAMVYEGEIHI